MMIFMSMILCGKKKRRERIDAETTQFYHIES